MFEVIISSVITGRTIRKTFEDSRLADRYIDQFFATDTRRDYRVEVRSRMPQRAAALQRPQAPAAA